MSVVAAEIPIAASARPRLHRSLTAGGLMLGLLVAAAVAGPLLSPYTPTAHDFDALLQPPSLAHPFGTDNFGRDVLTRIIYGAVIDLRIGVLAVAFPFVFGSVLGAAAGYYGRWVDTLVMRVVDVITAVPFLVLVIAVVAFLGPGEVNIFIAIGGVGWVTYARLVRGEVLREKSLEYVAAGRALGFRRWRLLLGHVLPNAIPPGGHLPRLRRRARHPHHRVARLPGPGRPAPRARVGDDDLGGARVPGQRVVGGDHARLRLHVHRPRLHPPRRRGRRPPPREGAVRGAGRRASGTPRWGGPGGDRRKGGTDAHRPKAVRSTQAERVPASWWLGLPPWRTIQ